VATVNHQRNEHPRIAMGVRWAQAAYAGCAWLFVGCIILQVFFAGTAVLVDSENWAIHRSFAPIIRLLPILMLVAGFVGRLPWPMQALTALSFGLFALQYIFIWVVGDIGLAALRGLHAVNALALFWIALYLGQHAWPTFRTAQ
jgi:hypothetical protein